MSDARKYGLLYIFFFLLFAVGYSGRIVDPVQLPRLMICSVFLIILLGVIWKERLNISTDFHFLRKPLALSIVSLCIFTGISAFSALLKFESLYVFSKSISFLLYFVLLVFLLQARKVDMQWLSKGVGLFALIILSVGLFQVTENPGKTDRIVSTMANKNLLASILFLSFPFLLVNLRAGLLWKVISLFTLLGGVLMLWLTEARGAMLATLVFCFILLVGLRFFLRKYDPVPKFTKIAFLVFIGISVIGGGLVFQNQDRFAQLFDSTTLSERKVLWSNTIEMIKDHPVSGVGAGNWKIHNNAYGLEGFQAKARTGLEIFQRPHNDFLWVFSELGIIGFLVYLSLFILAFATAVIRIRRSDGQVPIINNLLILGALSGYVVIAMFGYPLERVEQQIFLATYLALLVAVPLNTESQEGKNQGRIPIGFFVISALLIAGTAVVYLNRLSGEIHTNRMYAARSILNWNVVVEESDRAVNPFYKLDASATPIIWYKGVAEYALGNQEAASELFEEALELTPNDIHVLTNIASGHAIAGDYEEARKYFNRTIEIAPAYSNPRINMAKILYEENRFDEAFTYLEPLPIGLDNNLFKDLLPVLLKKKSEKVTEELNDQARISRINGRITSKSAIVEMYRESKNRQLSFEDYLRTL